MWGETLPQRLRKTEVLIAFFTLVFNSKASCSPCTLSPKVESSDGEKKEAPISHGKMVRDLLHHLDTQKSVQPGGIHAREDLRELVEALMKPLSTGTDCPGKQWSHHPWTYLKYV